MSAVVNFYRVGDPYGHFSNFSPHPVVLDFKYPTCEHYFQAQKFIELKYKIEIMRAASPMEAAKLGRKRDWPLRSDWETVKDEIMRAGVRTKVAQNSDVRELLLSTGAAVIVEHTANDVYWGDGGDGTGKNMLGTILMEIRSELTRNGPYDELANPISPPWEKHPEIPVNSIGWRMGYGEDYMLEWVLWIKGLTASGQKKYYATLDVPAEWQNWAQQFFERKK